MKKAQITLFLFTGLIVLVIFSLIFYLVSARITPSNAPVYPIQQYVQMCIESSAKNGLIILGRQSGRLNPEYNFIEINDAKVPILVSEINRIKITEELNKYMDEAILECVNNFSDFNTYKILFKLPKTETSINRKSVNFFVNFEIDVKDNEMVMKEDVFSYKANLRLYDMTGVANNIVNEPDYIYLKQLHNTDFKYTIFPYKEKLFVVIEDPYYKLNGDNYKLVFAVNP